MTKTQAAFLTGFIFLLGLRVYAEHASTSQLKTHVWPLQVDWSETAEFTKKTHIGPIWEEKTSPTEDLFALRPFYLNRTYHKDTSLNYTKSILYPLFIYRDAPGHQQWNILSLIRSQKIEIDATPRLETDIVTHYKKAFEVFPFYFDHQYYNPEHDYFGLFPLWGELKNRFFHDRLSWIAFPLYSEWERKEATTYAFLWPFIRYRTGPETKGFSIWPLFGNFEKANDYHQRFALWPLIYYHQTKLYQDVPNTSIGVLPFYLRETREGYKREDFIWPLFGYTTDEINNYKETRILYPLFAQGRGENKYLNQIAPFYTHSNRFGKKSTWLLWPFFNTKNYQVQGVDVTKFRLLYFLYQDQTQRVADESQAFLGTKKHLWPIFSYWRTKDGVKQIQMPSPLEPIISNSEMRLNYSSLFAIYRYQELAKDHKDMSMLFSLIHFERRPDHERLEIGPILGYEYGEKVKRFDILKGLLGIKSENNQKYLRLLWQDIPIGKQKNNSETNPNE